MSSVIGSIIIQFLKENPHYIFTNLFFMSLIPLNDVYIPKLYGNLFESIQNGQFSMDRMTYIMIVLSIIQVGNALMDINDSKQIPLFQQTCKNYFLQRIFDEQKIEYNELGTDVLSRILRSQHIFTAWYSKLTTFILPHILEFIGTLIYFFIIDFQLGTSFGILLLICLFVVIISPMNISEYTAKSDKAMIHINEEIDDILINNLSVHKENKIKEELKRLDKKNNIFIQLYNLSVKSSLTYRLILTTSLIGFILFFTFRCFNLLKQNIIAKSMFFSLIMIVSHLIGNVLWINDIARDAMFDFGSISNTSFLQAKIVKPKSNIPCTNEKEDIYKHIEIKNLSFQYDTAKERTLNNINVIIERGKTTIIKGEIGSGKSTLAKLILRLLTPTEGKLYLNGTCYSKIPISEFYKDIGVIPQHCILFNRSIYENIRYDNESVTEAQINDTLHSFGIMKHFAKLKNGIHTYVGRNGSKLSGGQRQLVWMLKLYFKNPSVIIMDEPSASIDKNTKELFKSIITNMLKDKTIVIITHDPEMEELANDIITVKNGSIFI